MHCRCGAVLKHDLLLRGELSYEMIADRDVL